MNVDLSKYTFTFKLYTIGIKGGYVYKGLLRNPKTSSPTAIRFVGEDSGSPHARLRFKYMMAAGEAVGQILTPYSYFPNRREARNRVEFHTDVLADEYWEKVLSGVCHPGTEIGMESVINAAKGMHDLLLGKARENWGKFAGINQSQLSDCEDYNFQVAFKKYVGSSDMEPVAVADHFCGVQDIKELSKRDTYSRKTCMPVVIGTSEWNEIANGNLRIQNDSS